MAAYDSQVIDRILPKIRQWEATMGRRISPQMLESMMKAEIGAESDRATDVAFRNRQLNLQEQQAKDTASAAKVKGVVDLASTAGNMYLTNKYLNRPPAVPATTEPTPKIGGTGTNPAGESYLADTGGQASIAGGADAGAGGQAIQAASTPTPAVDSLASYDAAIAEGASEGVGSTAGSTTPATGGGGVTGSTTGNMALGAAVGLATNYAVTQTGEGKKSNAAVANMSRAMGMTKLSNDQYADKGSATVGGLAAGGAAGAAAGAIVYDVGHGIKTGQISNELLGLPFADRFANTNVKSILDTVICTELTRQGKLSERDRTKCVVYRWRHIPDDMFVAYLEWATPIVALMKGGGITNMLLLPFAKAFVGYMISVQNAKEPTFTQRVVWKYAWWKCSRIAVKHGAKIAREVA